MSGAAKGARAPRSPALAGGAYGIAAAALFGASAPFAKILLNDAGPLALAALLYLGAGAGLLALALLPNQGRAAAAEAKLRGLDYVLLAAITVLGGMAGPILMLTGLARVSALTGTLLLNLEAPFTILTALAIFGEHLGLREIAAASIVILGAALLGYLPGELGGDPLGVLAIAAACFGWGIDNNLSQRLSMRDPIAVVRVKTLGAGACMLAVALAIGDRLPSARPLSAALLLGCLSYGLSLVFDMRALRYLGAAREAAYFASAPFIGAVISIPLFRSLPNRVEVIAALMMAVGIAMLFSERHSHVHTHEAIEHDHFHVHDEHHRHHPGAETVAPHSHPHRHEPITHEHPHVSDLHHRHRHA